MSKLIRENRSSGEKSSTPDSAASLTNTAVVQHLKACQKLAADHARSAFKHYFKVLDEVFARQADRASSNQDQVHYGDVQRVFRAKRSDLEKYFCGYVAEAFVKFKKGELSTSLAHPEGSEASELTLVGNEDLEETIAITSLAQRADGFFAEPIWALNQRFAVLNGGRQVTETNNPAAPIQLCESLRKCLELIKLKTEDKIIAYKVFDTQLLNLTRLIIEDINHYLKSNGILPNLKYTVPSRSAPASNLSQADDPVLADAMRAEGAPAPTESVVLDSDLPTEQYQSNLLAAIRGLQSQLLFPGGVTPLGNVADSGNPVSSGDLVNALQNMQVDQPDLAAMTADGQPLVPVDLSVLAQQLRGQLGQVTEDPAVQKNDMQIIDLVGMVFEYMLNDENIPDKVKAILSYLHTPFLKVAFVDHDFFEKSDHPARLLLNNLAEAGALWVGNDDTSQYGVFEKIREVVNRVLKDFKDDIKLITELLLEFSGFTKNIVRRQELMEKRAKEKAQGEEKLREVKVRVNEEIRSRTQGKELPSAVLLLLLQPWTDYLSFCLLRFGAESDEWKGALSTIDDLLWCINPQVKSVEKNRQQALHDDVIKTINKGFETIGFDTAKARKLEDAISGLIKMALQSKKLEPAPAPMRDELEKIAAQNAGEDALEAEKDASPEEQKMVESLKMIEFGTWFEFSDGKRLKVAWCNSRTSHYMLVNQMGKREQMISGIDLARKMIGKEAKIISGSSKPFFERALENIFHKLNEQNADSGSAA